MGSCNRGHVTSKTEYTYSLDFYGKSLLTSAINYSAKNRACKVPCIVCRGSCAEKGVSGSFLSPIPCMPF